MKTTQSLSQSMKNSLNSFSVIILLVLFIASCKKEEASSPLSSQSTASNDRYAISEAVNLSFTEITIDHKSFNPDMPDYSVTINANGKGRFSDRKGGTYKQYYVEFKVTTSMLMSINQLYLEARLSGNDLYDVKESNDKFICRNRVTTSITTKKSKEPIVWTDYNNLFPKSLVTFRTEVEDLLMISRFFKYERAVQVKS